MKTMFDMLRYYNKTLFWDEELKNLNISNV